MEEWMAMKVMLDAHSVGQQKLAKLEGAVDKLKNGETAQAVDTLEEAMRFFREDLAMHFRHEEQALFPVLGKIIGRAGPIGAMLDEHDSLWRVIDAFEELVPELKTADPAAREQLIPSLERAIKHIVWLLTSHIEKENSMLFPLAEKMLNGAGRQEVDDNVDTLGRMYAGAS